MPKTILYYNGIPLKDYCNANGFIYGTIQHRIKRGMTVEEALKKPIKWGGIPIYFMPDGTPMYKVAKQNKMEIQTIYARMRKGMSMEKAVLPRISKKREEYERHKLLQSL